VESELVLGMWQAVRSQSWELAGAMAERLARESEHRGRGPALCAARLGRALLPDRDGRWEELEQALRLAAARGYVRPLLDGGEPVRALLQASLSRPMSPSARTYATRVLARFDAADRAAHPRSGIDLMEPLTDREEEVLGHLFSGRSNKAIARAMFVSIETVKTHLKHVYGKLDVTSRSDAVTRARELGLYRVTVEDEA
jgi:LuxR family transcriptional regulator, maltose regulon positive regulatory protein